MKDKLNSKMIIEEENQDQSNINPQTKLQTTNNKKHIIFLSNLGLIKEDSLNDEMNKKYPEDSLSFLGDYGDIYLNFLIEELKNKNLIIDYIPTNTSITAAMRGILIDWIIEIHRQLHFKDETLFQTVWIIDAYLSNKSKYISKYNLQLLGAASFLIACKSQEITFYKLEEFVRWGDGGFNKNQLLEMENDILKILKFDILKPTSNDFYNILAKKYITNKKEYNLGKMLLEYCLLDYEMITYLPSVIAASCIYFSKKYFKNNDYKNLYSKKIVNVHNPERKIKEVALKIVKFIQKARGVFKSVKSKYPEIKLDDE